MKNFFQIIGVIALFVFGIFYTEKTVDVVRNTDDVMHQIKSVSSHYAEEPIEAVIKNNEMIPGIVGKEVDVSKSYDKMKRVGSFNEGLLEYKNEYPKIRLNKNYEYYIISGNPKKNMVSLLFLIDKNTDEKKLKKMLDILDIKNVKATFFIDGYWFEENNDWIQMIASLGHDLGNLSYNRDYRDSSFIWMDTIMKRIMNRKYGYCYNEKDNQTALDICKMYKNYTIRPSLVITDNPFSTIRKEEKAGDIISFKITDLVIEELPSIITYTISKGYKITPLSLHLDEDGV